MGSHYFSELLELAAEIVALADVEDKLDKRDWKQAKARHDAFEERFKKVRSEYVDALLADEDGRSNALQSAEAELNQARSTCDASWYPALDYTSENLLPYLFEESSKSPQLRRAVRYAPLAATILALFVYFTIRLVAATPITGTIDTAAGIEQRAAALTKIIRYDDWMGVHIRKGGWLKGILLWPIKPTEEEFSAGREFAGLAYAAQEASAQRFGCTVIAPSIGGTPSSAEIAYLKKMAEYVHRDELTWKQPPTMTVLDAARYVSRC